MEIIETKFPRKLKERKAKFGAFTIRQIIIGAAVIILDAFMFFTCFNQEGINYQIFIVMCSIVDLPILIFLFEPDGIPMERFLAAIFYKQLFYPVKRRMKNDLKMVDKIHYDEKYLKKRAKIVKKMLKEHPEYKPIQ